MSNPYGYGNVMGNQMGQMTGNPNPAAAAMSGPNSITMSAMMPPPPPPPPQSMPDYSNGMMQQQPQVSNAMQQNMAAHGNMTAMNNNMAGGNMNHMNNNMLGQMMGSLQPPPPPPVNPATNDAPLDFNVGRNQAPTPMPMQPGMANTNMMIDNGNNNGNNNSNGPGNTNSTNNNNDSSNNTSSSRGGDSQEDSKEGILSSSSTRRDGRDRDSRDRTSRDGGRDRDRDSRDRQKGGRGRDRDRDRDRPSARSRLSRERDRPDRDNSPSRDRSRNRRSSDRAPVNNSGGGGGGGAGMQMQGMGGDFNAGGAAPMEQYNTAGMATGMDGQQQYNQMAGQQWAPMWNPMNNPMGGAMTGPMAPMGPMTQMGAPMTQMGAPMTQMGGPMGPMTPMGTMAGTMTPTGEAQPITGEFRITWGMFGWMMSPEGLTVPVKSSLQCKEVTLVPPNRMAPPPTTRERPLGCRTVFVGGLPENVKEEMVCDVFERCGEITTVRLSKKNFAHIRYELEEFVENAIFLSGFRMRIDNSTDTANTGRLHVDYAHARDDLYEWECRQRALQREQRHRERVEAERMRPPSPPPVAHYTEHEAATVADHLKGEEGGVPGLDTFTKAAVTLVTWLERGDCTKRNTGTFYSMIQSTNSQVRRLIAEKMQYEDELTKFREQTRARLQGIVSQFGQIEKVFTACSQQKVWDHFTKAQRRNIDMWKKQAQEIKRIQLDDSDKEDADEMEVSDDESGAAVTGPKIGRKKPSANDALKEENDSLRCQLEAYKNEVDMVKLDLKTDLHSKDEQIATYKQALQGMQQSLTENVTRKRKDEAHLMEVQAKLRRVQEKLKQARKDEDKSSISTSDKDAEDKELIYEDGTDSKDEKDDDLDIIPVSSSSITTVDDKAAWLIGLTSTFLHIHPKGASVDYIWSYIQQFDKEIKPLDVENMLTQFPSVYKQITTGVGACLERKWIFTGIRGDS